MKLYKRVIPVLLAMLLLSGTAFAAGSIDLNHDVNVTVSYHDGDTPLVGAKFDIYLVASTDESGNLTAADAFRRYNVDLRGKDAEAWEALAATLEGYVLRDNIAPTDGGKTDAEGYLYLPSSGAKLTPGLYLMLGQRHMQGGRRYDAMPFMLMLPAQDAESGEYVYGVIVNPKHESSETPDTPSAVTRKVLKVWDDAGKENVRPAEVSVQLLRDGRVYDTVALNAGNNWRYTWSDLDDSYSWTVVEQECEDYTVRIERNGITFVITNTYVKETPDNPTPTEPTKPGLPQTGQPWWPVPLLLTCGLLFLVVGLICRKRYGDGT